MRIYIKYGIITVLMALLFNASSVSARTYTYKCGTVYVSNNDGKQWSEYRESQIKLYMEFDYPRMTMEGNEGDQYFYTFESYKKAYYKRDGKRLKKLIDRKRHNDQYIELFDKMNKQFGKFNSK